MVDTDVQIQKVKELGPWVHQIDLGHGIRTRDIAPRGSRKPANHPAPRWKNVEPLLPKDMSGMRVLDIGCAEGFFSFECAKRGAAVVGLDLEIDRIERARWAAEQLGFKSARFEQKVATDIGESLGRFDVTLMLALLYHLRDPLTAIEKVAQITTGTIVLETIAIQEDKESYLLYAPPGLYGNAEPKWVPTNKCVTDMLIHSGFVAVELIPQSNPKRSLFVAHKSVE